MSLCRTPHRLTLSKCNRRHPDRHMYGLVDSGAGVAAAITGTVATGTARPTAVILGARSLGLRTPRARLCPRLLAMRYSHISEPATPAFFQRINCCLSAGVVRFGGEIILDCVQITRIARGIVSDIVEHVPDILHEFKFLEQRGFWRFRSYPRRRRRIRRCRKRPEPSSASFLAASWVVIPGSSTRTTTTSVNSASS